MDRRECGHCGKRLSIKSLKEHRRLYFHDGKWLRNDEQDLRDRSSRSSSPISVSDIESNPSVDLKIEDMQQLLYPQAFSQVLVFIFYLIESTL